MTQQQEPIITLFDLPSRPPCKTWSLNPWKTRLYLNYRQIPYKTQWIEYPDITPTLSPHMAPNPEGSFAPYTIPTVILPDGTYMQESLEIAKKLEELYPPSSSSSSLPSLKIQSKYLDALTETMPKIMKPAGAEYLCLIPERLLNESSAMWWYPDREKRTGGWKLDVLRKEKGGETVRKAVAEHVRQIGELLKENRERGPFFEGETVSYADFVWVGFLRFTERIGPDVFDLVVCEEREVHVRLLEACRPWLERDSY